MRAGVPWRATTELLGGQYLVVLHQPPACSQAAALRIARYKSAAYTVERPLHLARRWRGPGPSWSTATAGSGPHRRRLPAPRRPAGVFGDPAVTGKPAGDDLREGKRTLLLAVALERAERRGDPAARAAVEAAVGNPGLTAEEVDRTRDVLTELGAVQASSSGSPRSPGSRSRAGCRAGRRAAGAAGRAGRPATRRRR